MHINIKSNFLQDNCADGDFLGVPVKAGSARSAHLTNSDNSHSACLRFKPSERVIPEKIDFEKMSFDLHQDIHGLYKHDKKQLRDMFSLGFYRCRRINAKSLVIYRNFNPLGRSASGASGYDLSRENSDSDSARYASKRLGYEKALANVDLWRFFATFTFDAAKHNRTDFEKCHSAVTNFLRRRHVQYFLVAELHKLGGIHFHALLDGNIESFLAPFEGKALKNKYIHNKIVTQQPIFNCPAYQKSFGYCTFEPIRDAERCCNYMTKYVFKSFDSPDFQRVSRRRFWCSTGLKTPQIVNPVYAHIPLEQFDLVGLSAHTQKCYYHLADYRTRQTSLAAFSAPALKSEPSPVPIKWDEHAGTPQTSP